MGAFTMGTLRVLLFVLLMGVCALAARGETPAAFGRRCIPAGCVAPRSNTPGILARRALPAGRIAALGATLDFHHGLLAQSPTYGVGRTPSAEEIRAWDISIGPTGEELPPGRGTAKEGAQIYRAKGCAGCHGATGIEGTAPILKSKAGPDVELWARGRILPLRAPFATTVWDYINRGMPLNREGTLTADEVYALTAFLLYINDVIPEDEILDAQSLPKVKMPIGDRYASLPEWKPRTRRLKGYPY
jgi:S-disulfanyl-L-cysteine oxidoreductase SoxD